MNSATTLGAASRSRLNISRWALEHPALTRYLMIVLMVPQALAGIAAGRDRQV